MILGCSPAALSAAYVTRLSNFQASSGPLLAVHSGGAALAGGGIHQLQERALDDGGTLLVLLILDPKSARVSTLASGQSSAVSEHKLKVGHILFG